MKLGWKQIDPFVKNPDPRARAVLVYGPDDGLMRERARLIAGSVVPDLNDPFNVAVINGDQLAQDPALLPDEAHAMSMMGGARLIRIESAGDKITPVLKEYLAAPSDVNLVVIEAGALGPKSPLRKLCESAKNAAVIPCYVEDERGISNLVREILSESGYSIQGDANSWLSANIAGDRMRARGEIEKLVLYMGGKGGTITLEDAQAACGEAGTGSLDDLVYAVAGNKPEAALTSFSRLTQEGVPIMVVLRTLQNHFRRLHYTRSLMQSGLTQDQAIKSLQPPIFFKYEPPFKAQIQRWDMKKLQIVMEKLATLEAQTKRTGHLVETF